MLLYKRNRRFQMMWRATGGSGQSAFSKPLHQWVKDNGAGVASTNNYIVTAQVSLLRVANKWTFVITFVFCTRSPISLSLYELVGPFPHRPAASAEPRGLAGIWD